jgi:alanine dehydrogenase
MEIPAFHGTTAQVGLATLPRRLETGTARQGLRIGVPREVSNEERRVALAPSGVETLVADGHEVFVEAKAGAGAHFADQEYADAGASIVEGPEALYGAVEVVAKVGPPAGEEVMLLREKQTLVSALHLGATTPDFLRRLMELGITGIGFEFIRDSDGTLPIVRMMHEIMGSMAVQIAARYLETGEGGRGLVLGGISGVPPTTVVILGAGVVGEWAARTALGYGAHVIVLDKDLGALRSLEHHLDRRITTAMATAQYLRRAVVQADVLIGAAMADDARSPILVTEEMVATMRHGAVIVDAVIDQGGCIETSRPTTFSEPTFRAHEVVHYCVPNIPSNAARTATVALTNVLVPYLLYLGEAPSLSDALWKNAALRNGTYVYRKHLTKKSLAGMFGMPHRDIELLIASGI